ncbi:AMP-binding protein [Allosphingosinicella indica]|uniref:Fatty-acyl-CoA synthase n=1 Tax=Allosphingosinicella indica TaxID=941907 RepID=A0A1X7G014_9SPHN|nr:AMP-binding protein [Allosphingosinicella indica]SMF61692.1 fatty-acyl-CoA synthase [Allosphingosinicella indica]
MTGAPDCGGRIGDILLDAIRRHGPRTAFIEGGATLSYAAFGARVAQALAILDALGLKRGETVAQIAGNCVDQYAVMAAAYIGGYRSVTLHPLGGAADQAHILADSDARLLIADAAHAGRAATLGVQAVFGHGGGLPSFWDVPAEIRSLPETSAGDAEDIVRLAYTGGTTGRPKGVMLSARALAANTRMALAGIEWPQGDLRYLCPAPISHGAGSIVAPVLALGGTVILQRGFDAARFCAAAKRHHATVTWLVPTMIGALLDLPDADLAGIETLIWSGAPMPEAQVRAAVDRFGPILAQCYGQTEAPNTILYLSRADHMAKPGSAGRPFDGIEVALCDESGAAVPPGTAGEICVRGPLLMSGYHGMPDATAETMQRGWLHTGDIGVVDGDGYWRIVDRRKDMIITGGFNVYPKEVEEVIAAQPGVAAVAVFGVANAKWGEAVTAVVVPRQDRRPDPAELIAAVREAKGPVMAPKAVHVVDALPLTALGKPDKKALRAAYAAG